MRETLAAIIASRAIHEARGASRLNRPAFPLIENAHQIVAVAVEKQDQPPMFQYAVEYELPDLAQVLPIKPSGWNSLKVRKDTPIRDDHLALFRILFPSLERDIREYVVINQLLLVLSCDRRFREGR